MAATVPNCRAYDPAFAGEFAVILDHGMRQMLERQVDEFYYVTLMNENYPQPDLPGGVEQDILKGMYLFARNELQDPRGRSEEHTSELQSLMRISYAVFC